MKPVAENLRYATTGYIEWTPSGKYKLEGPRPTGIYRRVGDRIELTLFLTCAPGQRTPYFPKPLEVAYLLGRDVGFIVDHDKMHPGAAFSSEFTEYLTTLTYKEPIGGIFKQLWAFLRNKPTYTIKERKGTWLSGGDSMPPFHLKPKPLKCTLHLSVPILMLDKETKRK